MTVGRNLLAAAGFMCVLAGGRADACNAYMINSFQNGNASFAAALCGTASLSFAVSVVSSGVLAQWSALDGTVVQCNYVDNGGSRSVPLTGAAWPAGADQALAFECITSDGTQVQLQTPGCDVGGNFCGSVTVYGS